MITMLGSPRLTCDGRTRRETLKAGTLSLLGGFFNLPSLLALEQAASASPRRARVRNVLLLYLQGGPATHRGNWLDGAHKRENQRGVAYNLSAAFA